jgi:hypothetical protein
MREFPGLVALHNRHPNDVVCISFNVDDGAKESKKLQHHIVEFLKKNKATCTNIVSSEASDVFYEATNTASIPVVFVYGKDGKLAETFKDDLKKYGQKGFSYEQHITPAVEKLLAGS